MTIFGNNLLCVQIIIALLLLPLVYCKVPDRYVAKNYYLNDGPRIIKGNRARPGHFPYQISIRLLHPKVEYHVCGGIIMSNIWVLTAAHCLEPFVPKAIGNLRLVAGSTKLLPLSQVKHVREIRTYILHPDYKNKSRRHLADIALMRVKKRWTFDTAYVKPIKRLYYSLPVNSTCIVSGFGLDKNRKFPAHLRYTKAYLFDNVFCDNLFSQKLGKNKTLKLFTKEILCTGSIEKLTRFCSGDSGGPLVCDNHLTGVVLGTVEPDKTKKPCLHKGLPDIYIQASGTISRGY